MKMCMTTASLRSCTLEEAVAIARALGFDAIDIDAEFSAHLSREAVATVDRTEIQRVRGLGMTIPNLLWAFGEFSLTPAINDPDANVRKRNLETFKGVVEFCHEAGILSLLILPGIFHPKQTVNDARALTAEVLSQFLAIAQQANVMLATESHIGSAFESPASMVSLLQQVPGLGLIHDYGHFIAQGYPQSAADALCVYTTHMHLRQAKNGCLQTPLEAGTINFSILLDELHKVNYTGFLCIENIHQNYLGANQDDVLTETIKMRNFLKARLG